MPLTLEGFSWRNNWWLIFPTVSAGLIVAGIVVLAESQTQEVNLPSGEGFHVIWNNTRQVAAFMGVSIFVSGIVALIITVLGYISLRRSGGSEPVRDFWGGVLLSGLASVIGTVLLVINPIFEAVAVNAEGTTIVADRHYVWFRADEQVTYDLNRALPIDVTLFTEQSCGSTSTGSYSCSSTDVGTVEVNSLGGKVITLYEGNPGEAQRLGRDLERATGLSLAVNDKR